MPPFDLDHLDRNPPWRNLAEGVAPSRGERKQCAISTGKGAASEARHGFEAAGTPPRGRRPWPLAAITSNPQLAFAAASSSTRDRRHAFATQRRIRNVGIMPA